MDDQAVIAAITIAAAAATAAAAKAAIDRAEKAARESDRPKPIRSGEL